MSITWVSALALGATALAEPLTLPPYVGGMVAAVNPADVEYKLCKALDVNLQECIESGGGQLGLETANPTSLLSCGCCISQTAIASAYSICSSYVSAEAPDFTEQISVYGAFYSTCSEVADLCTSGFVEASQTSDEGSFTLPTLTVSVDVPLTSTESSSAITSGASFDYPDECTTMLDVYGSCSRATDGFTSLSLSDQASCLCCVTSGSEVSYTDELSQNAETCADWALENEPETAYPVARTLQAVCNQYTDVCSATPAISDPTTTPDGPTTTSSDNNGGGGSNSEPTSSTTTAGASALRISSAMALVGVALLAAGL